MQYSTILILLSFILVSCGGEKSAKMNTDTEGESSHNAFYSNLLNLCGETFIGESTFPDEPDHDLVDTELRAHISGCDDNMIKIDLYRGGNTWHTTWVLERREAGLHLYHDHVGDIDEEELGEDHNTGYGGYADERGSSTRQYFPADDYTAGILPEAVTNVWMMEYNPETDTFVYYLERHGKPRFRAELIRQ